MAEINPTKLLIIEDDPDFIHLLKERLLRQTNFSFEVESVETIPSALERLSRGGIELILLDLNLKESKGFDTLNSITSQTKEIPIIIVTGEYDESIGLETLKLGAQDYLLKGQMDASLLIRSIRYALERKRQEKVLRQTYSEVNQLIAAVPSILIRINPQNQIKFWNKEAERVLGLSLGQVIHQPLLKCGIDWDIHILTNGLSECRIKKKPLRLEDVAFKRKNGEARVLGFTVSPIEEAEGTSVLIYGADITERRRLEAELSRKGSGS